MSKKSITVKDDAPVTQGDIDAGRLVPVKRVAGQAVRPKQRITLYLDAALIDQFKALAGERGYQTLINDALKNSLQQASIEATIRQAIREELKGRKAA